jgi:hypothetical protein
MPQLPAAIKKQVHLIYRTERFLQQSLRWQKKKHVADVVLLSDAVQEITATVAGAISIRHCLRLILLSIACAPNVCTKQ